YAPRIRRPTLENGRVPAPDRQASRHPLPFPLPGSRAAVQPPRRRRRDRRRPRFRRLHGEPGARRAPGQRAQRPHPRRARPAAPLPPPPRGGSRRGRREVEAAAVARAVSPGHAVKLDAYASQPLLDFVTGLIGREDDVLRSIREETPKRGLPTINIGPDEGRILHFLVTACGARRIVEVGTLAGYSACWLARALPDGGVLHTVEYDQKHAAVARETLAWAALSAKATVHEGAGSAVLPKLEK